MVVPSRKLVRNASVRTLVCLLVAVALSTFTGGSALATTGSFSQTALGATVVALVRTNDECTVTIKSVIAGRSTRGQLTVVYSATTYGVCDDTSEVHTFGTAIPTLTRKIRVDSLTRRLI